MCKHQPHITVRARWKFLVFLQRHASTLVNSFLLLEFNLRRRQQFVVWYANKIQAFFVRLKKKLNYKMLRNKGCLGGKQSYIEVQTQFDRCHTDNYSL